MKFPYANHDRYLGTIAILVLVNAARMDPTKNDIFSTNIIDKATASFPPMKKSLWERNSVMTQVALSVSHIYILAKYPFHVNWVPLAWRKNATLVDGRIFDRIWNTSLSLDKIMGAHVYRVTKHAHALRLNFSNILVLEDDIEPTSLGPVPVDSIQHVIINNNFDVIRVDYNFHAMVPPKRTHHTPMTADRLHQGYQCEQKCICNLHDAIFCTMSKRGCDIRSSAAYVLSNRIYERFIAGPKLIDRNLLNNFQQTCIVPLVAFQSKKCDSIPNSVTFNAACVTNSLLGMHENSNLHARPASVGAKWSLNQSICK